jgi:hypothetical protein
VLADGPFSRFHQGGKVVISIRTRFNSFRNNRRFPAALIGVLLVFLVACNQPVPGTPTVPSDGELATVVPATLTAAGPTHVPETAVPATSTSPPPATHTASPEPTQTATLTPTPLIENVSGRICYPSEEIPAMTVFFQDQGDDQVIELLVESGQDSYGVHLPEGTYQAYAWLNDFSRGGLYSNAVPCGLKAGCDDHSALAFQVTASQIVENIDLCDWYAGPFNVPYPPGKDPNELTGSISGSIVYPGGGRPELRVFAFNLDTANWYYVEPNPGSTEYAIPNLPPGRYNVVAYDSDDRAGGHTDSSHTLIDISVKSGETTQGVEIDDWNAPAGAFPADPTQ